MTQKPTHNKAIAHRPPIVVVLGHVDHGKTKLLDTIRKTNVAGGESGGITQHIGAYQVSWNDKTITFLDTPGHEAFSAIRSRGCQVADIGILVVAADESVKPQTKEAIRTIQDAKIPFIVAINKIDREGANPNKVKQDLAQESILVEGWGGDIPVVELSAKDGTNVSELLDMVLLVAELAELPDDQSSRAEGVIIESHLDKQRGYVATALIAQGILKCGDWITAGRTIGKVKSMEDFIGARITNAVPSQPVVITGWNDAPDIGVRFLTSDSKDAAEELSSERITLAPLFEFLAQPLPDVSSAPEKVLKIIFKSDVTSSLEALDASLKHLPSDKVGISIVDYGIGNIAEADVKKAASTGALIVGFRVSTDTSALKLAERDHINVRTFDVIYDAISAVRESLEGLLDPEIAKTTIGKLRVLALFKREGKYQILGGKVTVGKARRGALVTLGDSVIGKVTQLQHNKEDVEEVAEGREAGLRIDVSSAEREVAVGDVLELYEEASIKQSL